MLALREDRAPDMEPSGVFRYASELAAFLKKNTDLNIVGAGYPERGISSANRLKKDTYCLARKIEAGVTHINTQLFFDNSDFYSFIERIRKAGITVPVQAGIMPIVKSNR